MKRHQAFEEEAAEQESLNKRIRPSENDILSSQNVKSRVYLSLNGDYAIENNDFLESEPAKVEELKKKKKRDVSKNEFTEHKLQQSLKKCKNSKLEIKYDDLKNENKYLQQKIEQLEIQNVNYRQIIKDKEDSNSEQQILHENQYQKWESESKEAKELEQQLLEAVKTKEDEIQGLKNQLEETHQIMNSFKEETSQANLENENLVEEIKEKDEQIFELQEIESAFDSLKIKFVQKESKLFASKKSTEYLEKRIKEESNKCEQLVNRYYEHCCEIRKKDAQILLLNKKIEEGKFKRDKSVKLEICDKKINGESEFCKLQKIVKEKEEQLQNQEELMLKAEARIIYLQTRLTDSQSEMKNAKSSAALEKHNYEKIIEELKSKINQLTSLNEKAMAQKEESEKEFVNFQAISESKNLQMRSEVITDNAELPLPSIPSTTVSAKTNKKGPKWIISKEICQAILESNPKIHGFLKQYLSTLFSTAEILLPEDKLNAVKWKEAKLILIHFFKLGEQKSFCKNLIQNEMQQKRAQARLKIKKQYSGNCAIGISDTGKQIYFLFQPNNNRWEPFLDKAGLNPLKFNVLQNSKFCFPNDISANFIVIVRSNEKEYSIYKMTECFCQLILQKNCSSERKPPKK